MEWYQIIGVPAILGTIIPFFVTRHYKNKDNKEDRIDENTDNIKELSKDYKNLRVEYDKRIDDINKSIDELSLVLNILKESSKDILRDRIVHLYNHYYEDKKYMPIYARESLNYMYNSYKKLNGNGVVESLVNKMFALPTSPQDNEDDDTCNDIDI